MNKNLYVTNQFLDDGFEWTYVNVVFTKFFQMVLYNFFKCVTYYFFLFILTLKDEFLGSFFTVLLLREQQLKLLW